MTNRFASLAAAVALSFGAIAAPALAQAATFNAWGHEFSVPGSRAAEVLSTPQSTYTAVQSGSVGERGYGAAYRYSGSHAGGPANGLPRY
ncbi:hypothetical protein J2X36_004242 [Methylobacterium sp. BE186]|uniref:hypothetical protein n=1 Tax=Methylobacterium sp. BE186 TaxID=2817715 RepID=UPI002863089B|nr:hypothetical protein [Methylobacterium sp. BE186]MDR7039466.1 hypothetical protein [Methylobacterium sp. BE186]